MDLLKKLSDASGVSGRETEVRDIIEEELKKNSINYNQDEMGNLIVKKGNGSRKLMITAHMDEVGFIATFIHKDYMRVTNVGDINIKSLDGQLVKFNESICKIVNTTYNDDVNSIFVDMITEDEKNINEGTAGCFAPGFKERKSYYSGKALTSRALCYVLLNVIKKSEPKEYTVYFVFTVQNELKGRGARAAAYNINPDMTIVLEGEASNDYPGGEKNLSLNEGPVIRIMDKVLIMHHQVREIIENASSKAKVSIQKIVSKESSEGGELHKELSGIKTGVLALPIRYKHSSFEIAGKKDMEDLTKLLLYIIE